MSSSIGPTIGGQESSSSISPRETKQSKEIQNFKRGMSVLTFLGTITAIGLVIVAATGGLPSYAMFIGIGILTPVVIRVACTALFTILSSCNTVISIQKHMRVVDKLRIKMLKQVKEVKNKFSEKSTFTAADEAQVASEIRKTLGGIITSLKKALEYTDDEKIKLSLEKYQSLYKMIETVKDKIDTEIREGKLQQKLEGLQENLDWLNKCTEFFQTNVMPGV